MAKGVPETHPEERGSLKWSTKANWVTKAGGLPDYIESVAVALVRGGMPRERAIPTAVSVVRKTCATGLWGGRPNAKVSPAIRAAACKAAAEWEAKKGGAKLSACADCRAVDLAFKADEPRDPLGRWLHLASLLVRLKPGRSRRTDRTGAFRVHRLHGERPAYRVTMMQGTRHEQHIHADTAGEAASVALGHSFADTERLKAELRAQVANLAAPASTAVDLSGPVTTSKARGSYTTNALLKPPSGLKPRHMRALAKANANLAKSGIPKGKRRRVLKTLAAQLKAGKRPAAM